MKKIKYLLTLLMLNIIFFSMISCGNIKNTFKTDSQITKEIRANTNFDELYFDDEQVKESAKKQIGLKPELKMNNLNGKEINISDFKGKKIVIQFLKTTCSDCMQSLSEIKKVEDEHDEVVFLRYYLRETSEAIESKYEELGVELNKDLTFSGQDNNVDVKEIISLFDLTYVPGFYFVNEDGFTTLIEYGGVNKETLEGYMKLAYEKEFE